MVDLVKDTFWFLFQFAVWLLIAIFVVGMVVLVAMFPVPAIALMMFYWLFMRKHG